MPASPPRPLRSVLAPLGLFLAVAVAGILLSHFTSVRELLDTERIREIADGLGWRGPGFLFLLSLITPLLLLPRWPIAMGCGMLYGVGYGLLLATLCATAGAWLQFVLATHTLSHVADRWRDNPWMVRLSKHRDRAFPIILFLRAFPLSHSVTTNLLCGTLRIPTRTYLSATFLGMIPSTLMYVAWGKLLKRPDPAFYALAVGILALLCVASWLAQRHLGRGFASPPAASDALR